MAHAKTIYTTSWQGLHATRPSATASQVKESFSDLHGYRMLQKLLYLCDSFRELGIYMPGVLPKRSFVWFVFLSHGHKCLIRNLHRSFCVNAV